MQKTKTLSRWVIWLALALVMVWWSQQPGSAIETGSTYTVQPGDSLSEIASAHDTTVKDLVVLNADRYPSLATNPGFVKAGWVLTLPGGAGEDGTLWDQAVVWLRGYTVSTARAAGEKLVSLIPPTPTPRTGGGSTASGESAVPAGEIAVGDEAAENAILEMINQERVQLGLEPLVMDEGLRARARERSRDMLARGYFSHYDPETGARLGGDAWEVCGTSLTGWKRSPPHYAILTDGNLHRIGIGIARQGSRTIVTGQLLP